MPENQLFLGGFFCYLAAAVSFLAAFWLQAGRATRWGIIFFALAFVGHSLTVGVRWLAGGGCFSSIYEFILLFSWVLTALFLLAGGKFRIWPAGVVVAPCQVGLLSYVVTVRHAVQPLVPALQSGWLVFHVAAAVLAYACFTLGAGFAGVDLWRRDSRMAATGLIYRLVAAGFLLMTLVLFTGAVWAEEAWGVWWNWDPKETWALVTWLIFAVYLHMHHTQRWSSRVMAGVTAAGFAAMLFTLLGVTSLMPGLHSY